MELWGMVHRIEPLPLVSGPFTQGQYVRVEISARRTATDHTPMLHSLVMTEAEAAQLRVGRIASIRIAMDKEP